MPRETVDDVEAVDARELLSEELSLLALLREALHLSGEESLIPPSEINRITDILRDARNATFRRAGIHARTYLDQLQREERPAQRPTLPSEPSEATVH
jgi:hypothetical protein